jgi:hypothetical protein
MSELLSTAMEEGLLWQNSIGLQVTLNGLIWSWT